MQTNLARIRQQAASSLQSLVNDLGKIQNPRLYNIRLSQYQAILNCIEESENYIGKLEIDNQRFLKDYLDIREVFQRLVYICESCGIYCSFLGNADNEFFNSKRLKKLRDNFPHIRLDDIPSKAIDWLMLDEICESAPFELESFKRRAA